jgi:hypothetical protein
MSFTDLFSEKAKTYAAARPRYPEALFTFVAALAPARRRAWDCGTGNGQAAVSLVAHFAEVCASDPSAEQVAHAIAADRVSYSVQPAERTSFPDRHFDAICVAQALHWFEFAAFFAEVRRVAVPGAAFAAWGYDRLLVSPEFDARFQTVVLDALMPYWPEQNRLLWNGYADVPLPFERMVAPTFEIRVPWNFPQWFAYLQTWSAMRRCVQALGADFLVAAERALLPLWGAPESRREVVMPLHVLAARVA